MTINTIVNLQLHQTTYSNSILKCSSSTNLHSLNCRSLLLPIFSITSFYCRAAPLFTKLFGLSAVWLMWSFSSSLLSLLLPPRLTTIELLIPDTLSWCHPWNPLPDLHLQSSHTCVAVRWQKISWNWLTSSWFSGTLSNFSFGLWQFSQRLISPSPGTLSRVQILIEGSSHRVMTSWVSSTIDNFSEKPSMKSWSKKEQVICAVSLPLMELRTIELEWMFSWTHLDRNLHASKLMETGCSLLSYQVSVLASCVRKSYHLGDNIYLLGNTLCSWAQTRVHLQRAQKCQACYTEGLSLWEAMLRGIESHCWFDLVRRLCCSPSTIEHGAKNQLMSKVWRYMSSFFSCRFRCQECMGST